MEHNLITLSKLDSSKIKYIMYISSLVTPNNSLFFEYINNTKIINNRASRLLRNILFINLHGKKKLSLINELLSLEDCKDTMQEMKRFGCEILFLDFFIIPILVSYGVYENIKNTREIYKLFGINFKYHSDINEYIFTYSECIKNNSYSNELVIKFTAAICHYFPKNNAKISEKINKCCLDEQKLLMIFVILTTKNRELISYVNSNIVFDNLSDCRNNKLIKDMICYFIRNCCIDVLYIRNIIKVLCGNSFMYLSSAIKTKNICVVSKLMYILGYDIKIYEDIFKQPDESIITFLNFHYNARVTRKSFYDILNQKI